MNYKEIIESRYNRQNWQLLLRDIFGSKIKFWSTPSIVATSSAFAKQALWLGTITLSDGQTIAIYEVELADSVDIERNRRGIRDMLLTTWRNNGNAGAFMFCYRKRESVLRFSYVSEAWKFAEDGSYQKETTDARRFTYLLGEGHRSRTAIQQFERLRDSSLSLKDLTKAFSVDAVSDMFFDGYKKQYEDIIFYITGKRMVKVANKWEERLEGKPCQHIMQQFSRFPNPEKAIRDYVKKLMGRLVFLQFLQKKGWLGVGIHDEWGSGDPEFIQNLFARCDDKDHFIDKVLEPLFNDLNSENEKKLPQYRTPYLNGGLFEQEAADGTDFPLPEKYMKSLLDFFASYNFTIDENDPDDAEVGVDPEMLGRIFENLLEDNKDKGAFYTPKEIVSYMCRESLIAYLQTGIEDETTKEAIRQFVTTHQVQEHLPENTDQLLKDVKICDPAIGSGAFPMGLLKELFLCRTALEGISQHQAAEIKKHIIQQNVYGVDIERGAVDIARLRFWLSLIVDEETPQALPNLDFKIMQGNSLLEQYKGVDLSKLLPEKIVDEEIGIQATLFAEEFGNEQKELQDLINSYYDCTQHIEKKAIKEKISSTIRKQIHNRGITVDFGDLDLSGNNQFFLWHTWFHDVFSKGGFDIVIGNPPYISAPTQIANPILAEQREQLVKSNKYRSLYQKWDLYIPFIELGIHQNSINGITTMIVPFPLTNQLYAKVLRKMLVEENNLFELVDLNGTKIFENATVSNCIPFIKKTETQNKTWISKIDENLKISRVFEQTKKVLVQDEKTYIWNVTQEKREANKHTDMHVLGDYCYISKGMVLHSEEGEFTKDDLISLIKDAIHSKEYVEAKDIERYNVKRIRFLEYNTDRSPSKFSRPTFSELYSCKKIVMNCLGGLNSTIGTELTHNHSLYCAVLWCDLQNVENKSIASSIKKFSSMKRSDMEKLSKTVDLRYLLGVMNSNYAAVLLTNLRGGDYHIYPEHIRNIPIPTASSEQQQPIIELVDNILNVNKSNPNADTSALENEIDRLVYHLYGLTYDEVLIIDPTPPFTREEYERGARN